MDFEQNKYALFIKVVETGNISKTAEMTNYTQSGVSHAIAALEKEIGFPLLIRGKNGVKLTPRGRTVLPEILALVNQQRKLDQVVSKINNRLEGRIRIGSFTSVTALLLPDMIAQFEKDYPGVEVDLFHGDYKEIEKWVEEGSLDCGFISGEPSTELDMIEVFHDEMKAVVSKKHSLAGRESVGIGELVKSPLILQSSGFAYDASRILAAYRSKVHVKYELSDDIEVAYLAAKNLGVGLIPKLMLDICAADVCALSLDPPVYRNISIVAPHAEHRNLVTNAFIAFAKEYLGVDIRQ